MPQQQSQGSLPFDAQPATAGAAAHAFAAHALPADQGVWDELRAAGGALRAPWRAFVDSLPQPPAGRDMAEDLGRRVGQVEQRIRLDGVTHNVFSEGPGDGPGGVAARPWSLQLLPLLIESADWAAIEAGVRQRAELLERVLADLYGPQTLLKDGLLPPALQLARPRCNTPICACRTKSPSRCASTRARWCWW